jgi:glucose dehydrogenase
MTNEEIHQVEVDAQEDEAERLEIQRRVYEGVRTACLCALVQQNYGKVIIRKEFLNKFLAEDMTPLEVRIKQTEDGHYELSITDIVDADAAVAAATH